MDSTSWVSMGWGGRLTVRGLQQTLAEFGQTLTCRFPRLPLRTQCRLLTPWLPLVSALRVRWHTSPPLGGGRRENQREVEKMRKRERVSSWCLCTKVNVCNHFTYVHESRCTFACVWGSPSLLHSSIALSSYTLYVYNEEFRKRVNSISEEWGQTHVFRLECKVLWLESLSWADQQNAWPPPALSVKSVYHWIITNTWNELTLQLFVSERTHFTLCHFLILWQCTDKQLLAILMHTWDYYRVHWDCTLALVYTSPRMLARSCIYK